MKSELKDTELQFTPITIEITFTTKAEVECFYSVMNHAAITDAARPFIELSHLKHTLDKSPSPFDYHNCFDRFAKRLANHPTLNKNE
jgi:hypothetical protein